MHTNSTQAPDSDANTAPSASPALVPSAWEGPVGQLMPNVIFKAWAPLYPEAAAQFAPLYSRATLDALRAEVDSLRAWEKEINAWHDKMAGQLEHPEAKGVMFALGQWWGERPWFKRT